MPELTTNNKQHRQTRPRQQPNTRPRRRVEDVINSLPSPWEGKVIELSTNTTARKRLALLALRGEYGYKLLMFVRINAIRTTQTEQGSVEAVEAFDILPQDVIAASTEANLLSDDVVVRIGEEMADLAAKQAAWVRPEARPLAHRPLQRPLAPLAAALRQGATPAPKKVESALADLDAIRQTCDEVLAPPAPARPTAHNWSWWWAAAAV